MNRAVSTSSSSSTVPVISADRRINWPAVLYAFLCWDLSMLFVLDRSVCYGVMPGAFGQVFSVFLLFGGGTNMGAFVDKHLHTFAANIHF
jgi:hypothetical protein